MMSQQRNLHAVTMLHTLIVWLIQEDYHIQLDLGRFLCRIGVCEEGPNLNQTLLNAQNPVQMDREIIVVVVNDLKTLDIWQAAFKQPAPCS